MQTKSIRATIEDAKMIEQTSRVLAAKLQRKVTVSEIVHELMECLKDAEKRIENRAVKIGKKEGN
jgi:hypothetical protein